MRSAGRMPRLGDICRACALAGAGRRRLLDVGSWRMRQREMKRRQQKDPQRVSE